jgi:hypothetical protein
MMRNGREERERSRWLPHEMVAVGVLVGGLGGGKSKQHRGAPLVAPARKRRLVLQRKKALISPMAASLS